MAFEDGRIDLHIHSTASDGSLTPMEILAAAREAGLGAVAITDHDTVEGVREVLESQIPAGLEFAPGVEISAEIPSPFPSAGTLHILGYFIDPYDEGLSRSLQVLQDARADRNPKIIRRLQNLGLDVTLEEVEVISGGGQVGRPHIAQALVQKGLVSNAREAFDYYLAKDRPAYVGKHRFPARQAVEMIIAAGGVAVCAHPFSLEFSPQQLPGFIAQLKEWGLAGIEVHYPQHGPDLVRQYLEIASKLDLLVTGGTDFHGASKPDIQIGFGKGDLKVPMELFRELKTFHDRQVLQSTVFPEKKFLQLEQELGYSFVKPDLLAEALCHSSFANENPGVLPHNERLEFLGDAVIDLVVGHLLMEKFSDQTREGDLSRIRAALVNEAQLADIARSLHLGRYMLLGKGEARASGWDKNSILADCLEALTAAVYLDGGFEAAARIVRSLFGPLIPEKPSRAVSVDYKTRLQEYAQAHLKSTPVYAVVEEAGPDHDKTFQVRVTVDESLSALGSGRSKKAAEQDAAQRAWDLISQ